MHGLTYEEFLSQLSGFLCGYYVLIAAMNGLFALYRWKQKGESKQALAWSGLGLVSLILAAMVASGNPDVIRYISFNESIKGVLDGLMSPTTYSLGSLVILLVMFQ